MTLRVSLCIKCIVAASHASWPRGMFWAVELMLQSYDFWVSRWISVFWALVFKLLPVSFFPFTILKTSNHFFESYLSQLHSATLLRAGVQCGGASHIYHFWGTLLFFLLPFFFIAIQLLISFFLSFPFLVFVFDFLGIKLLFLPFVFFSGFPWLVALRLE